jgi:hypothetical protein
MRGHSLDLYSDRGRHHRHAFTVQDGAEDLIKELDGRAWEYLLEQSGLKSFLDADARAKWSKAIEANDYPPLTRENIHATFRALYDTRGDMFERGVVEIFRSLSWDYRTNSPRKFGKRLILRYAVHVWKDGSFGGPESRATDRLDDLLRVMSVLDGKPEPDYRQRSYTRLCEQGWPKTSQVADLGYLSLRGFKNGNGHVTFVRLDLVDKLNEILAKHHPNALPPADL